MTWTGRNGPPAGWGKAPFVLHCTMETDMSAQKMTNLVDRVAMTLVNAALLAALPISAVLFVTSSL